MRFDMRAPRTDVPRTDLYSAAIEMSSWAEQHHCLGVVLCEHHGSDDGYLPTPLILGSAIAARTQSVALSLIVILPFYDPVRLAEEMAVLDIISRGRASYIFGLGYRPEEFEHFGLNLRARGRIADTNLGLLQELFTGEPVVHGGRRIKLSPAPYTPGGPMLMWGGGSLAAARRAGRYGLGLIAQANVSGMQQAYEAACREYGHQPGPTLLPDRETPSVCFVADDVDEAWREIGEYLLHDARTYAEWNPEDETSAGISHVRTVDELRAMSRSHRIFSVAEAVDHVRNRGMLTLAPLCGGMPPDLAWSYLRRVQTAVLPELATL